VFLLWPQHLGLVLELDHWCLWWSVSYWFNSANFHALGTKSIGRTEWLFAMGVLWGWPARATEEMVFDIW